MSDEKDEVYLGKRVLFSKGAGPWYSDVQTEERIYLARLPGETDHELHHRMRAHLEKWGLNQ